MSTTIPPPNQVTVVNGSSYIWAWVLGAIIVVLLFVIIFGYFYMSTPTKETKTIIVERPMIERRGDMIDNYNVVIPLSAISK